MNVIAQTSTRKNKWNGIPQKHKRFLDLIINGENINSNMGRVIIGRDASFLYNSDPLWTQDNLLPQFDWSVNEDYAGLLWHGYLSQNRVGNGLFEQLLPYYR